MKKPETLRKLIHMLFSLLLASPLLLRDYVEPGIVYGAALALGGLVYSMQVKGPPDWLRTSMQLPQIRHLETIIESFERLVSMVERDYERRSGWLGLISGLIGGASSYFIFGPHVIYGVLGLFLVDGTSTIVGMNIGVREIPFTNKTAEGTLAGFLSFLIALVFVTRDLLASLIMASATALAELYGIEDNVTVPLVASAVAHMMALPLPL